MTTTTLGNVDAGAPTKKIVIADAADWSKLGTGDVIIDPMVLRYGEVFLAGAANAGEQAHEMWRAIAADVGGLLLFFDQIMLRERIPVFNYGDTFDSGKDFAERVLASVNRSEDILAEVDVQYTPYWRAKAEALDQVREVLQERGPLPEDDLSREVIRHLSVFEYDWNPSVTDLGLQDERQERLAAFLVGGLVFGAYAQQTGAPHVLQPKRSRLFTAVSLRSDNASDLFDENLFGELAKVVRASGGTVADIPTLSFVPTLLARGSAGETATDLLDRALAFRSLPVMREYRSQLALLFSEWAIDGRINKATRRSVRLLTDRVARELGTNADELMTVKLNAMQLPAGGVPLDAGVDLQKAGKRLWGWAFPGLINRGSRKLLARASVDQSEYLDIAKALRSRWTRT
jgi:hypothetical protein